MSKPAENKFYNETLLTLNVNSSDGYVKSIYDDIAEKYDKVLYTFFEILFSLAEVYWQNFKNFKELLSAFLFLF